MKHLSVPYYENLTINEFLKFAKDYPGVMNALPLVEKERNKLPRQYIINVIYTVVGQPFRKWVNDLVDTRHENVIERRELSIVMDPKIAEIYRNSKAVSTNNGASFNMLKAGVKRRRTKQEIKEQEEEERQRQAAIEEKLQKLERMEQELGNIDEIGNRVAFAENAVSYLQDSGLLRRDENGNFHEVNNWQEH